MKGKILKCGALVVVLGAISYWLLAGGLPSPYAPATTTIPPTTTNSSTPLSKHDDDEYVAADTSSSSSPPTQEVNGNYINKADKYLSTAAAVAAHTDIAPPAGEGVDTVTTEARGDAHSKKVEAGNRTGYCPKLPKKYMKQFYLNAFLVSPKSVEVQIFNAFAPLLNQRCKYHALSPNVSSTGPLGFFVDVGGNNGKDVAYWLEKFGGCDSPCGCGSTTSSSSSTTPTHQGLHFVVFEPQDQYQPGLMKMAHTRDSMLAKRVSGGDALQRQSPLTVVQAAVGKSSQHDTNLVLIGSGEQGVVNLDEHKKVQLKEHENIKTVIKIKSLVKVLDGIAPLSPPVVALKVDAEGADATILVASAPLFAAGTIDFVIFELNKNVRFFEVSYDQSINMLRQAGYRTFLVGVAKTGATDGMLTYIALEVDARFFRRHRVSLETIIAVSPSMAVTMQEKGAKAGNLFGGVGVNGRALRVGDPLLHGRLSTSCYLSAYAWEGPH